MHERVGPDTRVVFIANPNNPTGGWLAADALERFITAMPGHVMVVYQVGATVKDPVTEERSDTVKLPDERAGINIRKGKTHGFR